MASPLTVQPSGKDNWLYEGAATSNFGTSVDIQVNNTPAGYVQRSILEFAINWGTDIPAGATITSATLNLYYYNHGANDPAGRTYWAYRLTRTDWVEIQSTWNIYKTGSNWTAPGGDYTATDGASLAVPAGYGWMAWNVLAQVQYAQTNTVNVEFLVKDGTEDDATQYYALFHSNNYVVDTSLCPKLVIAYTIAGWANIKNIPMGTGKILATDIANIRMGTGSIAVADISDFGGVAV